MRLMFLCYLHVLDENEKGECTVNKPIHNEDETIKHLKDIQITVVLYVFLGTIGDT